MPHYCMNCDAAEMVLGTRDVTVNYKDLSTMLPGVAGWHCPACGEIEFTDEASSHAHMQALQDLVALHKEQTKVFIKSTHKNGT